MSNRETKHIEPTDPVEPVTIEDAARRVKMNREAVRSLVKESGIGILWGGSVHRPILRVLVREVRAVIVARRAASVRSKVSRRRAPVRVIAGEKLNPLVRC